MVSHTYTVAHSRAKLEAMRTQLKSVGGTLMALVPSVVDEPWGTIGASVSDDEQDYVTTWAAWPRSRNSIRRFHPGWEQVLDRFRPTHVHVEEEPYSLITLQVLRAARARGARFSFFSWENIERALPPPMRIAESIVCWSADRAVAGNQAAAERLARRMPAVRISVAPQLGIDIPEETNPQRNGQAMRVIYVGRLVQEKGVLDLAEAALRCPGVEVSFLGKGAVAPQLRAYADRGAPVQVLGMVPHDRVRDHILANDVLVLPSLPTKRWEEQFGHVLIEAMAVGVIPVGSTSGAIPEVIGDESLVFPYGNVERLADVLAKLASDPKRRSRLGRSFRVRAEINFTHERVAALTLDGILGDAEGERPSTQAVLVADSPSERWASMDLYAREVGDSLRANILSGQVRLVQPPGPPARSGLLRVARVLIDRYLILPSAVRRVKAPVVHILDQTYAHLIRSARPARVVITCHDLIPLEMPRRSPGSFLYRRAVREIRRADHVIAISEATRRQLVERLEIPPDRVTVVPYGLDPSFFEATWEGTGSHVRILHVGSNADYKRIWLVVETAARLAAMGRQVELWKVGDPLDGNLAAGLGGSGAQLTNFGRIPNLELPGIFAQATLLMFPSAYEGFGRPVAEAMAVGLPVVASDIASLREITGGSALHVPGADPGVFADEIDRLLSSPERLHKMGAEERAWAKRYRWEPHAKALADLYEELAKGGRNGQGPAA